MKITEVRIYGNRYPVAFVEVFTDEGITGIGATGTQCNLISPVISDAGLDRIVIGENPCEPRRLWTKMFIEWQALRGRGAEGGLAVNAMAAIDMALWDITGKVLDLPLYKMLGGETKKQVMAYASSSAFKTVKGESFLKSLDEIIDECRKSVDMGFKAIKYGWGNRFGEKDENIIASMRECVGKDVRLMFDFGCPAYWTSGWNVKSAIRAARILEKYDVYFLEEPFIPCDTKSHKALKENTSINIASGESLTTIYEFMRFIEESAVDIIQPDACQIGITKFFEVACLAEKAGILCIPHSPWSALAVGTHLNILATVRNGEMIEYPAFHALSSEVHNKYYHLTNHRIVQHPPLLKDGFLHLSSLPGLGLGQFDHEILDNLYSYDEI